MNDSIKYLARTYFHQDYDIEAPTPLGVVRTFPELEVPATVKELADEVRELLRDSDDEAMRALWLDTYGAQYDPRDDGMTYREWFTRVLEILEGR